MQIKKYMLAYAHCGDTDILCPSCEAMFETATEHDPVERLDVCPVCDNTIKIVFFK